MKIFVEMFPASCKALSRVVKLPPSPISAEKKNHKDTKLQKRRARLNVNAIIKI